MLYVNYQKAVQNILHADAKLIILVPQRKSHWKKWKSDSGDCRQVWSRQGEN